MAENETGAVAQEQQQEQKPEVPAYPIRVEDVGPGTKKVSVEIPPDRIAEKLEEQYKELRQEALLPGFRKGHAPRKLIEKRFAADVKDQVRRSLISESYEQALEKNSLNIIGEPEFENADQIKLPEDGPLNYSFTVEVQPEINLPELKAVKIKRPKLEVAQEHVDQAMKNLREQQGTLNPVADRGVQKDDRLVVDVHVKIDGNEVAHQHDAVLISRPARVGGFMIDDLDQKLEGIKAGETRTVTVTAPPDHQVETFRGKPVDIEVRVKDIKQLQPAEIDQTFLDSLGFATEQELTDALREQLQQRVKRDIERTMRAQVVAFLMDNTTVTIPSKLSKKQSERVVSRRAVDLMLRGIPRAEVEANIERLRTGAEEEASKELKSFFVLQKLAEQESVDVSEGELNGRIAEVAAQDGRRPEKLKQDMAKDGSLSDLYIRMREEKAIDKVIGQAEIEDVDAASLTEEKKDEANKDESSAT